MEKIAASLNSSVNAQCVIAGGGPAGMMLAYLLARAGIEVVIIEKWPDFFRDFRGDTIHPSTMEVLKELGLLEEFLKLPHDEMRQLAAHVGGQQTVVADFSHLPVSCPFIAFIPQWDFLNFMAGEAKKFPGFHLYTQTEATDVITENGVVTGIKVKSTEGNYEVRAKLTIAADGRRSALREKAGLEVEDLGAPMDVLWFRLTRKTGNEGQSLGYINDGRIMLLLNRTDYWQCGFIIKKDDFENIKNAGLDAFRDSIVKLAPLLADVVNELKDWEQVKTLTVKVDHLKQWYKPGLLCIGDSAHAMSPVGGVGINIAIQDAVAAANILVPAFKNGMPTINDLRAVQQRRSGPARLTQRLQLMIQNRVVAAILHKKANLQNPLLLRIVRAFPVLQRIPARIAGMGFRPEHIRIKI